MKSIVEHFPTFKPRGDIDVFVLGSSYKWYQGPAHEDHIYAWVDEEFAKRVERGGGEERMMQRLSRSLNAVVEVTGVRVNSVYARPNVHTHALCTPQIKPEPAEECPNVFVCPIPNSDFSVRLFPGAFGRQEYCLDFVRTDTREAVNSPFDFEMWAVPGPSSSPQVVVPMRIRSLESASGVTPEDMKPGAEKFVLRDGMNCLLKRPGHRTARFVVPIRVV